MLSGLSLFKTFSDKGRRLPSMKLKAPRSTSFLVAPMSGNMDHFPTLHKWLIEKTNHNEEGEREKH